MLNIVMLVAFVIIAVAQQQQKNEFSHQEQGNGAKNSLRGIVSTTTEVPVALGPAGTDDKSSGSSLLLPGGSAIIPSNSNLQVSPLRHVKVDSLLENYSRRFAKMSRASPTHLHTVVFAIKKLRMDELRDILDDISNPLSINYGKHLTDKEINDLTTNVDGSRKLLNFLENHSMGNARVEVLKMTPKKDYVTARASVGLWERFFNTEFYHFERIDDLKHQQKEPLIRAMEYSLPIEMVDDVLGVFNVADVPIDINNHVRRAPRAIELALLNKTRLFASAASAAGTVVAGYVTPALLNQVYNIDSNTGSASVSQGVYETNTEYYSPTDLSLFQSFAGVPVQPVATSIGGRASDAACANTNTQLYDCYESNLDLQYMMGVSQVTPTTYYYILETSFMLNWLTQLAGLSSPPLVLSVSWGADEVQVTTAYMNALVSEAIIVSAKGVTLVASSGDDGANSKTRGCVYTTNIPASIPYFTTLGATNGPQSGSTEKACQSNLNTGVITSGGGISSTYTSTPTWQAAQVSNYFATVSPKPVAGYATSGRAYPDVSLLGAKYITYVNGKQAVLYGTSASAPVFAAMVSLVNAARKAAGQSPLGWINPSLYALSSQFINDITSGDNKCTSTPTCCSQGFTTAPGWDPVTGLGSINFKLFKQAFMSLGQPTAASTSSPTASRTGSPSASPSAAPVKAPTTKPSAAPSAAPTTKSPVGPTVKPVTFSPSLAPVRVPTTLPSVCPSTAPTTRTPFSPSVKPVTAVPSLAPVRVPTTRPSTSPSAIPTVKVPSAAPVAATTTIGDGCISAGTQYYTQPGYYCVGLQALSCQAGFFCPGGQGGYGYSCPSQSTSSAGMSVCVPLTSSYGGGCTGCSAQYLGAYCGNAACYACPTGSYCPGNDRGYLCPAGTSNSNNIQQAACVPNATPVYGDGCGNGLTRCSNAGNYCVLSQGQCFSCPAGSYCPNAFGSYAYACPAGKTSLAGAASCH